MPFQIPMAAHMFYDDVPACRRRDANAKPLYLRRDLLFRIRLPCYWILYRSPIGTVHTACIIPVVPIIRPNRANDANGANLPIYTSHFTV